MTRKVCSQPRCPVLVDADAYRGLCDQHKRERDRARGSKADRGYDAAHEREAKEWRAKVARGDLVICWRCGDPISDPADCHLGHDDHDRSIVRGPEHARRCNLSAAGRASHRSPDS